MNDIKRFLSCLSVLVTCLFLNMGVDAKNISSSSVSNIIKNKTNNIFQQNAFILHNNAISSDKNVKIADHYSHYSHSSHSSHSSHYSSRF